MSDRPSRPALSPWAPLPRSFRDEAERCPQAVLLETSRRSPDARSYLFVDPITVLEPKCVEELRAMFARMDQETARGRWVAGYVAYEAGYALESKIAPLRETGERLAWVGVFESVRVFDHANANESEIPQTTEPVTAELPSLSETPESYTYKVNQVHEWIAAGETYQANLSMEACWPAASGRATFDAAMAAQPVEYGAWLRLSGAEEIISASPELFFRGDGRTVQTRPMKGTAPRGRWWEEDEERAAWLATDEKNRAENLMIVDLLRNDLGRICEMGSVRVDRMFAVQRYPTLLQMTSDVSGTLRAGVTSEDLFRALFPSGSIVGAPKIRTMELLHQLEGRRRGVYTGAIGWQGPGGTQTWSVAIRTIHVRDRAARMGVGSGIVWDSEAKSEFAECRTKCAFLQRRTEPFGLIETMLWNGHFERLDRHIARLERSAEYFDLPFDEHAMRASLDGAAQAFAEGERWRVRSVLEANGAVRVTATQLHEEQKGQPHEKARLLLVMERTSSRDTFLFHKTTRRKLYDDTLERVRAQGFVDALFCNSAGEITEGAIHNIFVQSGNEMLTPPMACGVLPGILRAEWIERGIATERRLMIEDLRRAQAVVLTNAVRGAIQVGEIEVEADDGFPMTLWLAGGTR